jgi:hypothetical protein
MNRPIARFVLLGLACLIPFAHPAAQAKPDPWYSPQPKPNVDEPKVFTGTFSIQLPKNWHLAPGRTNTVFSVAEHTKKWETLGFITLEYMRLDSQIDPSLMTALGNRELKEVQSRELSGKQFSSEVKTGPIGPVIFIQYDRPGISGTDDHVAQYSIPAGTVLYRLICIAPTALVEKYRPLFAHVAASFKPLKPGGS